MPVAATPGDEKVYVEGMSVRELKAFIEQAGLSHADCFELSELRDRAREAEAGPTRDGGSRETASVRAAPEQADSLRERRPAPARAEEASDEEIALKKRVAGLVAESGQVISGRDACVILGEVDELKKAINEGSMTAAGRKQMLDSLEDVKSSLSFESTLEQHCGRFIQIALLAMTILPALLTFAGSMYEFAIRPAMVVEPANLSHMHAVVTGGCGAVGLDLAIMLANSGAEVVISCHGSDSCDGDDIQSHLSRLGLLRGSQDEDSSTKGWIDVWPLQLEEFESVREFAAKALKEWDAIDILVHNAATKDGCRKTVDGHDMVTQVNYLSPFLLTQLLLPKLREESARVVHVTCDAGLLQADWLPWPLRRTQAELLPRVDLEGLEQKTEDDSVASDCSPLVGYANSKLAVVVHSQELNRRLSGRGVSHVVNPGAMDSAFGRSDSVPTGKGSRRSSMMGNLPPVWIANKMYEHTFGKVFSGLGNRMLRDTNSGAKAIFHVATAASLGDGHDSGGGLFADTEGAFTDCGRAPAECGRVPPHKQPVAATDEDLAADLWARSEEAIG